MKIEDGRWGLGWRVSLLCFADDGLDDGGSGAGGGGDGADGTGLSDDGGFGADGAKGGGDGAGDGQGQSDGVYRPEGLPDDLVGESDKATIDKLAAKLAASPAAPDTVDGYGELIFGDDFVKAFGAPAGDDKALSLARDVALKAGMPADMFQAFVPGLLEAAVKGGLIERPFDLNKEIEAAGGQEAFDKAEAELSGRLKGLEAQGKLEAAGVAELQGTLTTAAGQKAMTSLFAMLGERGIDTGKGQSTGAKYATKADIEAAMADDRYNTKSLKFDQRYADEVDAALSALIKAGSI